MGIREARIRYNFTHGRRPRRSKPRLTVDLTQMLAEVPSRLARVEAHVEVMRTDIAELKGDAKALRGDITGLRGDMTGEFKAVRADMHAEFKFLLRLFIGGFAALGFLMLGLAGMVAHGFGWLK